MECLRTNSLTVHLTRMNRLDGTLLKHPTEPACLESSESACVGMVRVVDFLRNDHRHKLNAYAVGHFFSIGGLVKVIKPPFEEARTEE